MDPAKAQQMADLARDAGDPVGQQRYLCMLAAAKAAESRAPTTRQRLEKAEQKLRDNFNLTSTSLIVGGSLRTPKGF